MRADVARDAGDFCSPRDHPVDVAAIDWLPGGRPEHQLAVGPLCAARLERTNDGHGQWHGGRLGALADQVQDPVAAHRLGVVLDPDSSGRRRSQGIDAEQVGQSAVMHGQGLGNLKEADQLEPV